MKRIIQNSRMILDKNPMKTKEGKNYWISKQEIIQKFIDDLGYELGIEEYERIRGTAYNKR